MRTFLSIFVLIAPLSVSASSVFGTFPFLPEDIYVSGAKVVTSSSASASTGGQTVTGGKSVTTNDSEASVSIQNSVRTSETGGYVRTTIETSENGNVSKEVYEKTLAPGETVRQSIGTTSSSKSSSVRATSDITKTAPTRTTPAQNVVTKELEIEEIQVPVVPVNVPASSAIGMLSEFFTALFSLFTFWN